MKNQVNIGDQHRLQPEQESSGQSIQIAKKTAVNYLVIGIMVVLIIILLGYVWYLKVNISGQVQNTNSITSVEKFKDQTSQANTFLSSESITQFLQSPELLKDSKTDNWNIYTINEVEVSFKLPPQITDKGKLLVFEGKSPELGYILCFTYENNINNNGESLSGCDSSAEFSAGTTSTDFSLGRGGGFLDYQGYGHLPKKEDDSVQYYYIKSNFQRQYEVFEDVVSEVKNPQGVSVFKIYGVNSYKWGQPLLGTPGQGRVGAIINIPNNPRYTGLVLQMNLGNKLTLELFDQILSTLTYTK